MYVTRRYERVYMIRNGFIRDWEGAWFRLEDVEFFNIRDFNDLFGTGKRRYYVYCYRREGCTQVSNEFYTKEEAQ